MEVSTSTAAAPARFSNISPTTITGTAATSSKQTLAVNHNSILSASFINEFKFGYSLSKVAGDLALGTLDTIVRGLRDGAEVRVCLEGVFSERQHLRRIEGLHHVVERPVFHRLDGGFHGTVSSNDNARDINAMLT